MPALQSTGRMADITRSIGAGHACRAPTKTMLVEEREGVGGGFGEVEDAAGEDAEIQGAGGGNYQSHDERGATAEGV